MQTPTKQMKMMVLRNRRYRYASRDECSSTNLSSSCRMVRTHSKRFRLDIGVRSLVLVVSKNMSTSTQKGKTHFSGMTSMNVLGE